MKIIKLIFSLFAMLTLASAAYSSEILKMPPVVVGDKFGFTEGPVWVENKNMWLFTDIPKNKIYSLDSKGNVNIFMDDSGYANGLMVDKDNNIWIAHHCRRVSYTTPDGKNNVVASKYNGKKFNSPNDLVQAKDGSIWFTDPNYGIKLEGFGCELAEDEQPVRGIYRIKNGKVSLIDGSIELPNGIAFSNNEKFLYVSNSADGVVYRFDVNGDKLSNKIAFAKVDDGKGPDETWGFIADGLQIDKNDNLYVTGGPKGFALFSPKGKQIELFTVDSGFVSNVAIGGPKKNKLMVTAHEKLLIFDIK